MLYSEAEQTLRQMLRDARVDLDSPDPFDTWNVFKEFAGLPVEGVDPEGGDMFLYQWGLYDWHDGKGEQFEIDFTRQFTINDASGEYDHMEQLHCTFYYEPTDQLRAFESGDNWLDDLHTAESFPVFAVLRDHLEHPISHRIEQEQV